MKKNLILIFACLIFCGCGNNPTSENYTSFYGMLNDFKDKKDVARWINERCIYNVKFNNGQEGMGDKVQRAARFLFKNKTGACFQYASLQCYAARWHGKKTGIIIEYDYIMRAYHAKCWIEERNGTISITTNIFAESNIYDSYESMIKWYDGNFNQNDYAIFDETGEKVIAGNFAFSIF